MGNFMMWLQFWGYERGVNIEVRRPLENLVSAPLTYRMQRRHQRRNYDKKGV